MVIISSIIVIISVIVINYLTLLYLYCTILLLLIEEETVTNSEVRTAKADSFKKVAEKRTVRVLDSLRLLGQCANRRSYEYTDSQVNKIFREIRSALRDTEQRFKDGNRKTQFKL